MRLKNWSTKKQPTVEHWMTFLFISRKRTLSASYMKMSHFDLIFMQLIRRTNTLNQHSFLERFTMSFQHLIEKLTIGTHCVTLGVPPCINGFKLRSSMQGQVAKADTNRQADSLAVLRLFVQISKVSYNFCACDGITQTADR